MGLGISVTSGHPMKCHVPKAGHLVWLFQKEQLFKVLGEKVLTSLTQQFSKEVFHPGASS